MTTFGALKAVPTGQKRNGLPTYRLTEDFCATDPVRGNIVVKAGYVTDNYSVPIGFRWLSKGLRPEPAILHDWVKARGVTSETTEQCRWATGIFNRAMKSAGVPAWRRVIMLAYVAVFTFADLYL